MEWYEAEVQELERARATSAKVACPVVFYGSSSIRLWTTLTQDLGEPRIVNAGFGGSTLSACVYFFERLVAPLRPGSLVVYAGDNDLGDGRRPKEVFESFRQLLGKVEKQLGPIPFGFLSVKISPARWGLLRRIREVNEMIRDEITRHPQSYFVDVSGGMLGEDGRPRAELFLEDGLHLSPAGYQEWASVLRAIRNKIFTPDCGGVNAGAVSFIKDEPRVSQVVQPATEP